MASFGSLYHHKYNEKYTYFQVDVGNNVICQFGWMSLEDKSSRSEVKPLTAANGVQKVATSERALAVQ